MITVRFANGFSVTYNTANYAEHGDRFYRLRDKEGGVLIALVPKQAMLEWKPACKVFQAGAGDPLDQILHSLETRTLGNDWAAAQKLKRIKQALVDFDARRGCWK